MTAVPPKRDSPVGDSNGLGGQFPDDPHARSTSEAPNSPPGQMMNDTHCPLAGRGLDLYDPLLGLLAATVDDLENTRKATANRYRQLTRVGPDADGRHRGLGLSASAPDVARMSDLLSALGGSKQDGSGGIEHQAILALQRQMRVHPLWKSWGVHQKGIGEKQLARLLAAIGDPYWNDLHNRPRTVSQLCAYTGFHVVHPDGQACPDTHRTAAAGVAPSRTKGQKANWSTPARMRVWNIVSSCIKSQGHYYEVYLLAREKYQDATHSVQCVRCGPSKKPALPGSPLSDAHKHARAVRYTAKEILKDLWSASKALHEQAAPEAKSAPPPNDRAHPGL